MHRTAELTDPPLQLRTGGRLRLTLLGMMISAALMSASASAAIFIDVGSHALLPDTPTQTITINVSNTGKDPVVLSGVELLLQVADGGPERGGSILGPRIESVDLLTGTLFETENLGGQFPGDENGPQFQYWNVGSFNGVTLEGGANPLLATVAFDTTGFLSGTWSLHLAASSRLWTHLLDFNGNSLEEVGLHSGTLTVVPEPSATATVTGCLLLSVLLGNMAKGRLRRKGE